MNKETHDSNHPPARHLSRNRLQGETSPYLLQHADNPVDWYPWGPEALAKAREENKPILLSIGYSACHWCHVMAHESFEDADTAEVMNALFINIKVDREERPDLDKIYQTAHSLLTQRAGGWPLTMVLTPDDQVPFFAGTYFPSQPRHGMPAFTELLRKIEAFYRERETDIRTQNQSMMEALTAMSATAGSRGEPSALPLDLARQQLEKNYDAQHGGFGSAPKFPHPTNIERLLRHWSGSRGREQEDLRARDMALTTLRRMALGGMNDQLGGGFCRYSVDDQWMIPHFEKMLYDNGPLLALYAQAHTITGDELFKRVCDETAGWVMREMQSPEGGYYSSLDADSEGEEGKFYVWEQAELKGLLGDDYPLLALHYGFDRSANFEGRWNPHVYHEIDEVADKYGLGEAEVRQRIDHGRMSLLRYRSNRVWPGRDDKILTAWNGLMIKGMAVTGRLLAQPDYIASAERSLDFIKTTLWQNGRLLATCKDGRAHLNAYLDDYVYLMDAILELLQARWRDGDLSFCLELAEVVLTHFEDEQGGFFFTADDHETLIQRPKPLADDAMPSGNGVAATVLQRLGHLLGETRYLDAAERSLKAAMPQIQHSPYAHTGLMTALEEYLMPMELVILRGEQAEIRAWQKQLAGDYAPRRLCIGIPTDATDLPGLLAERRPADGTLAYLCRGQVCSAPIHEIEKLRTALSEK